MHDPDERVHLHGAAQGPGAVGDLNTRAGWELAASIISHSDDAIIAKSMAGTVLSWNAGAEKIFGYTSEEMIGQRITRLFPDERMQEEAELIAQVESGGEISHFETQRIRKDGTLIDVSVTLSVLRDSSGRHNAVSKIARDITDRKRMEAQVQQLSLDLAQVLDDSPLMISLWDADQRNLYANSLYAQSFGLTPAALRGQHLSAVLGDTLYAIARPRIESALAGQPQHFEHALTLVDGRVRYDSVNYVPSQHMGERSALFVFIRDITRRVEAELAAIESAQRFQRLYEDTPAMVHASDPQGRLLSVSNTWLKNLGYAREQVLGTDVNDYLTPQSRVVLQQARLALAETGHCENIALQAICQSGQQMDVLMSAILERDGQGQPLRALVVLKDVTDRLNAERSLKRSEALLNRTGALAGVGGWELDLIHGELSWSAQTRRIHGVAADHQPTVDTAIDFYAPEAQPIIRAAVEAAIRDGVGWDLELPFIPASGEPIWVRATGQAEFESGQPVRLIGAFQDITERRALGVELASQHELMRVTLNSIGDAVLTTDALGRVTWLNPVAERMTGWTHAEAEGRLSGEVLHLVHQTTRELAENPIDVCLRKLAPAELAHLTVLISRNGIEHGIEDSVSPIRAVDGAFLGAVLVFHDVTEQRRISSELNFRATHDALTGLVNRAEFEMRLDRVLEVARQHQIHVPSQHALMYIDLDQFKLVNDACGHSVGDQLLQQVSRLLGGVIRSRDTLARLGGDEFAIILEHCDVEQAQRVAQTICDRMDDFRFFHDERRFRIGASIGLVPLDHRWPSKSAVMQAADASCYAAKEAGRNRVHLWFDTDSSMRARRGQTQWVTELEKALDEDGFVLHMQRIVPLKTDSQGLRAEVLLRMLGPDGGLIPAGQFLPAAERFHLAPRIDRWVIREVIQQLLRLPSHVAIELITVNVSGQSVGDRAFHRDVVDELRAAGPELCGRLCIEITETAAITNLSDAALFIDQLRELGVRTALDDFGAGSSSFSYLKSLKFNVLKIDGQFVRDILDDPLDDAAVRCFVDVARVIGVECVAEYVEVPEVLSRIRELGVDYAQGFLLHKPEDMASVLASLRV